MKPQLRICAIGHLRGKEIRPSDLVNKWKVEGIEKEVFIDSDGAPDPTYCITGRPELYKTPEEALAVLQKENDDSPGLRTFGRR
ncbi:MAG: hypothetical protein M3O09_14775 [Acidobacteriota bacterium]|nr:hypothetical protein [Acidobacteriota bacterium]